MLFVFLVGSIQPTLPRATSEMISKFSPIQAHNATLDRATCD